MLDVLAKINCKQVPYFAALTYPDNCPTFRDKYKRDLEAFVARLQRRWPGAAVVWKLEFQVRKSGANKGKVAPHYHLFIYGVPWEFERKESESQWCRLRIYRRSEEGIEWDSWLEQFYGQEQCGYEPRWEIANRPIYGNENLGHWFSRNWYEVVGSGDLRHYRAGTKVEKLRSLKGAFAYAAKSYMAKKDEMPVLESKPGRFWGIIGRKNLKLGNRVMVEISESIAVQLRRTLRRYRRANAKPEKRGFLKAGVWWRSNFTVKLYCNVDEWWNKFLSPLLTASVSSAEVPPFCSSKARDDVARVGPLRDAEPVSASLHEKPSAAMPGRISAIIQDGYGAHFKEPETPPSAADTNARAFAAPEGGNLNPC